MAEGIATRSSRGYRTICLPIEEEDYLRIIHDPKAFRRTLDDGFRQTPELFPVNFALGYELKDDRISAQQQIPIRRIRLKDDSAYSIRPSFLMPYMTARTADVEGPLFLRQFGVPFWALARVFGGDPMSWYRMECGLGRFSVVGTTVRTATLPEHLLADEHHQGLDGQKVYIATTVGNGCCLGAEPAEAAGTDEWKVAYQVFKDEACDVSPKYAPKTVSTDGWKGTQAAWKLLFTKVVILLCFLHGWLKIRDRAKHLNEVFAEVSRRVWDTYHAPDRRSFAQRLHRSASQKYMSFNALRWRFRLVASDPSGQEPGSQSLNAPAKGVLRCLSFNARAHKPEAPAKGVFCLSFNALRWRFRLVASDFPGIACILDGD